VVQDIDVLPAKTLSEIVGFLRGFNQIVPERTDITKLFDSDSHYAIDYAEVMGQEHAKRALEIAAALAQLLQGDNPLLLQNKPQARAKDDDFRGKDSRDKKVRDKDFRVKDVRGKDDRASRNKPARAERSEGTRKDRERAPRKETALEEGMVRYRIEVGHEHSVKPGNIVGAIANEAGIDSQYIGRIDIHDTYSTVDLPEGMPKTIFKALKKAWVAGQQMNISVLSKDGKAEVVPLHSDKHAAHKGKGKGRKKDETSAVKRRKAGKKKPKRAHTG
jgi:ATP-dependent RNA helicase DeaD